jgi:hypothetical protein
MKMTFILLLGLAGFIAAAKGHGRQVRLEREAHGVHHVVFGGTNPPLVEELWRGDRVRFWIVAPIVAVLSAAGVLFVGGGGSAALSILWAPVLAFAFCAIASALRLRAHDLDAFSASLPGALGWFALALALSSTSAWIALTRSTT